MILKMSLTVVETSHDLCVDDPAAKKEIEFDSYGEDSSLRELTLKANATRSRRSMTIDLRCERRSSDKSHQYRSLQSSDVNSPLQLSIGYHRFLSQA